MRNTLAGTIDIGTIECGPPPDFVVVGPQR